MWENIISVLMTPHLITHLRACFGVLIGLGILLFLTGCQTLPSDHAESLPDVSLPQPLASPVLPSQDSRRSVLWEPDEHVLTKPEEEFEADETAEESESESPPVKTPRLVATKPIIKIRNTNKTKNKKIGSNSDLWHRIRDGYQLQIDDDEPIRTALSKYLKYPRYFDRLTENASPWLYHIVSEVEERGMPLEIALLPAVESNFEPRAISPRSAAGIWQFMPETGKYFGLEQNALYDGRQDIIASTDAALTYLQRLHRQFDGDWFNALAAYNWGEGNVQKAINKNIAIGKPTDYWSLDLPNETREFVPRLLAITSIINNSENYGVKLKPIADTPYIESVALEQAVDLEVVADIIGLNADDIKRLNPGYRSKITSSDGEGIHSLTLPIDKANLFRKRIAALDPKSLLPDEDLRPPAPIASLSIAQHKITSNEQKSTSDTGAKAKTRSYRIRKGDNLSTVAKAHNTDIATLKRLNRNLNSRKLKVGTKLRVPINRD